MPYLQRTIIRKEEMAKPFFGVEFSPEHVAQADRLEIWSSSFTDPGEDWNRFDLKRGDEVIASQTTPGY